MHFGDELILRATNERVILLGILNDEAGLLLVGAPETDPFEITLDEVMTLKERHGCACCI